MSIYENITMEGHIMAADADEVKKRNAELEKNLVWVQSKLALYRFNLDDCQDRIKKLKSEIRYAERCERKILKKVYRKYKQVERLSQLDTDDFVNGSPNIGIIRPAVPADFEREITLESGEKVRVRLYEFEGGYQLILNDESPAHYYKNTVRSRFMLHTLDKLGITPIPPSVSVCAYQRMGESYSK